MTRSAAALLLLLLPAALHAQGAVSVSVFEDSNGNGARDGSERPVRGVVVSNQRDVVTTDASGVARIERGSTGVIFVSTPSGYRNIGPFWRSTAQADSQLTFALRAAPPTPTFRFVHASDPHIAPDVVGRTRRLRQVVDSIQPDFSIVTGDLIRDAMSQQEPLARSYFELFEVETRGFAQPLWTVPGNHDHFGIIPSRSRASPTHPLYDRGMYRLYRGPDYYSFNYGGVHFIALNTLMPDDSAYYGQVDSVQLGWLRRDLAAVPPGVPVVTFNHIPMVSAWELLTGFADMALVASVRRENGITRDRHTVANVLEVRKAMSGHPWVLALGGHMHAAEKLVFQTDGGLTRFEQVSAVVGSWDNGELVAPSGITLYTVRDGVIDAGQFIRLDPPPKPSDR